MKVETVTGIPVVAPRHGVAAFAFDPEALPSLVIRACVKAQAGKEDFAAKSGAVRLSCGVQE